MSETDEVSAATRMAAKNRMAATALVTGACAAMLEKMYGSVSKTRPGPAPGAIPAAKTAGRMAKLAR